MSRVGVVQFLCRNVLIGPVLRLSARPRCVGRQHIPRRGPVILAANHLAAVDSLYVALAARRTVYFLAKSDYFTGRGLRGTAWRWLVTATGQIPVDRRGGESARPALDAAVGICERGGAWCIHPEGTRSPDGAMYRGRTGAVRVALRTGAPLIPVAIAGTAPTQRFWRRERVRITVLAPMDLTGVTDDASGIRAATDALMRVIATETGQHCVDDYARRWPPGDTSAA